MIHYQVRKIHIVFEEFRYIYGLAYSKDIEQIKFNNLRKAINIFGRIDTLIWFLSYLIDYKINTVDADLLEDNDINTVEKLVECLELGKKYEWFVKYNHEFCLNEEETQHLLLKYENKISEETTENLLKIRAEFDNERNFNLFLNEKYKKKVIEQYYEDMFKAGIRINCTFLSNQRMKLKEKLQRFTVNQRLAKINKIKYELSRYLKTPKDVKPEWIMELEHLLKTRFVMAFEESCIEHILSYINNFQKNTKKEKKNILTMNLAYIK